MATTTSTTASSTGNRPSGKGQAKRGKDHLYALYGHPLPLLLNPPPSEYPSSWLSHVLGLFGQSRNVNPKCTGVYDLSTRSVWIVNSKDTFILWQRGFFGKGSLSRSEPSWLPRRIHQLKGPSNRKSTFYTFSQYNDPHEYDLYSELTAEEVTARRRELRKQFKSERAQALAAAAAEAEAIFAATGQMPSSEAVPAVVSKATFQPKAQPATPTIDSVVPPEAELAPGEDDVVDDVVPPPDDMEHLQLTLQEAFFLTWTLGCLDIIDSTTVRTPI